MNDFQDRIEKLFPKICSNIYCGASVPIKWEEKVIGCLEKLNGYPIQIAQIKEKFGTLRIYYDVVDSDETPDLNSIYSSCEGIINQTEEDIIKEFGNE